MSQRITSTDFPDVQARLGIRGPIEPFDLAPAVVPVSLVDLDVPLTVSTPILDGASSEGELTAPAAAVLLADTGARAAGNYFCTIWYSNREAIDTSQAARVQRRDAANAANIWAQLVDVRRPRTFTWSFRIRLEQGERIRVLNVDAATAGVVYHANIWLVLT